MNSNQPLSQLNPKSPVYSPTSFNTPNKHSYTPNMDSGYYSSTSPYLHNKSRVYSSPGSPFPHTNLFHHPKSNPNRQDIYTTPTKTKPNPNKSPSNKVNLTPVNDTQTHAVNKIHPDTTKVHSSSSDSVPTTSTNNPVDTTILKSNIVHETPSIINTSTTQTVDLIKPPNLHESTTPTKSKPNPNEPPSNKVNLTPVNDTQTHSENIHPDTTKAHSSSSHSVPTTNTNIPVDTTILKPNIVHETPSIINTSTTQAPTTSANTPVDTTTLKPNIVHETPSIINTSTTQTVDPIKPPNLPESESPHLPASPTISDPKVEEYPPPQPYSLSDHNPSSNVRKSRKKEKQKQK